MAEHDIWAGHEATIRRFWAGQVRGIASLTCNEIRAPQSWDDAARLARTREELAKLKPDPRNVTLPSVFPDYGTVSMPRYWGGRCRLSDDVSRPFIEPVAQTVAEALALTPRPADAPDMDAARAVRLWRACLDGPHGAHLWSRTPDFQGVLSTLGLIMNQEELLVAMHEEPERVQALLQKVCDHLIAVHLWQVRETGGRVAGSIWPYTVAPSGLAVSFTEDLWPLISAEHMREFCLPYLRRLNKALGPLQIHCCGEWARHVPVLLASDLKIAAMEFHYPFTSVEDVAPLARAQGMALVSYCITNKQARFADSMDYYRWLWRKWPDLRFWFLFIGEPDDAILAFLREVNG